MQGIQGMMTYTQQPVGQGLQSEKRPLTTLQGRRQQSKTNRHPQLQRRLPARGRRRSAPPRHSKQVRRVQAGVWLGVEVNPRRPPRTICTISDRPTKFTVCQWASRALDGWNAARWAHRPKWVKLLHRVTASKYMVPANISSLFWQFVLQTLQRYFHDCSWQFVLLIPQGWLPK